MNYIWKERRAFRLKELVSNPPIDEHPLEFDGVIKRSEAAIAREEELFVMWTPLCHLSYVDHYSRAIQAGFC